MARVHSWWDAVRRCRRVPWASVHVGPVATDHVLIMGVLISCQ